MCSGGNSNLAQIVNPLKPVDSMSATEIHNFLIKYPTPKKLGGNGDANKASNTAYWNSVAKTPAGVQLLTQHAANRVADGNPQDSVDINAALKVAQASDASGHTIIKELPKGPAPLPSPNATHVALAQIKGPQTDLRIPLLTTPAGPHLNRLPFQK